MIHPHLRFSTIDVMRLQAPFAMRHAPGASTDPQPVIRVPSTAAPAPRPWQRAPRRPRPSRWVPWPLNPTASAGLTTAPGPWPRPAAATRPAGQPHRGGAPAATGARLMSGHHTLQRHYRSLGGQNGVDRNAVDGTTEGLTSRPGCSAHCLRKAGASRSRLCSRWSTMPRLLTIDEAANELGVPAGSLRRAAERHGFLVRMGRAIRIDPNDLGACAAERFWAPSDTIGSGNE